ncbi:hypothetical protein PR048_026270 [Dryococelus australis]|uniref:Uncharacterized protein n=1 Tax=Dryococelus australis TaxID=614101 RepID=A0ABQ9GKV7_9NEOP|nr:hypothetical protein PR048_026270 [Dryococelus australis]
MVFSTADGFGWKIRMTSRRGDAATILDSGLPALKETGGDTSGYGGIQTSDVLLTKILPHLVLLILHIRRSYRYPRSSSKLVPNVLDGREVWGPCWPRKNTEKKYHAIAAEPSCPAHDPFRVDEASLIASLHSRRPKASTPPVPYGLPVFSRLARCICRDDWTDIWYQGSTTWWGVGPLSTKAVGAQGLERFPLSLTDRAVSGNLLRLCPGEALGVWIEPRPDHTLDDELEEQRVAPEVTSERKICDCEHTSSEGCHWQAGLLNWFRALHEAAMAHLIRVAVPPLSFPRFLAPSVGKVSRHHLKQPGMAPSVDPSVPRLSCASTTHALRTRSPRWRYDGRTTYLSVREGA